MVLDDRTVLVANKVSEFLKNSGDRYAKTIVFCTDIDHAERMRMALRNANPDLVKEKNKVINQNKPKPILEKPVPRE